MSQSGKYGSSIPGGTYVQTLTGNSGGAVGPTAGGNINVDGSGVIGVAGNPGTNTLTASLSNGTNGQVLIGGGTAPNWANITSTGGTVAITNGANTINLEASSSGTTSFVTDSGTANEVAGSITVAGGANIDTSGSGSTVTVAVDPDMTAINSITTVNGGALRTGTTAGHTTLLQGYDTNGSVYTTLATITAGNTPTLNFDTSATIGGNYIYRVSGTDVAITDGGTGISTTPTDGQLLVGRTATNDYTLATLTPGTGIGISNGSGSITVSASASVPTSFVTDSGTATPALNSLTVTGGTNIGSTGAGSTVTLNLDSALTGISSVTTSSGGSLQTGTTAADTLLLKAYDNTGASYTTFATLTAGLTPTMDLADSVTKASSYIYRAGGTDVAIADGGTGLSTTPTDGQLLIGKTATNDYALATLTAGANISITNGSGTISIAASGGMAWSTKSGDFTASVNNGYLCTSLLATLPATAAVGDTITFVYNSGADTRASFYVVQQAGQSIKFGNLTSTVGGSGGMINFNLGDSVTLVCSVANTTWRVVSSIGNWGVF